MKLFDRQVDFTAHFDNGRVTFAGQGARNRLDGEHVCRYIFTDDTVASGGRRNQLAVLVAQVDCQAVNLEFTKVRAADILS